VPVLSRCEAPACEVLTIGRFCIRHDATSLTIVARQRRDRWDRGVGVPSTPKPVQTPAPAAAK